jgi:hypothetical protein
MLNRLSVAVALLALTAPSALADALDYAVTEDGPGVVEVHGDGAIFVEYLDPAPGATYSFAMSVWPESGNGRAPDYPATVPIGVKANGNIDPLTWGFAVEPASVTFSGPGDVQTVTVSFTVPADLDLSPQDHPQFHIQADGQGVRLGLAHGVFVRFTASDEVDPFTLRSWLSDSKFVPMTEGYGDTFQIVTKSAKSNDVAATNPGSFYYNVLVTTAVDIERLSLHVDALPPEFSLWGANSTHVFVGEVNVSSPDFDQSLALRRSLDFTLTNVPAGQTIFLTVHVQFTLPRLPAGFTSAVYRFSSDAIAEWTDPAVLFGAESSASMTGVRKR